MKVLVTGASGFIGSNLINKLDSANINYIGTGYKNISVSFVKKNLKKNTNWSNLLKNTDHVVHLAGLAHRNYSSELFNKINYEGSVNLIKQCIKHKIKKFVFLSSISVMGDYKTKFSLEDEPKPVTPYGLSKLNVEKELIKLCKQSNMQYVIIRPPLVYGFLAPGNFRILLNLIKYIKIIPIGSFKNRISILGVNNLTSFIIYCLKETKAKNRIFFISDQKDLPITEFFKHVAYAINKKIYIIKLNKRILQIIARIFRFEYKFNSLINTKIINSYNTYKDLPWRPQNSVVEELKGY